MLRIRTEDAKDLVRAATAEENAAARADLEALALPRLAGSEGAREVDARLRERIEEAGYGIEPIPFSFSAWPGLYGIPIAGAAIFLGAGAAMILALNGMALAALLASAVALACGAGIGAFGDVTAGRLPWGRRDGVNWLATADGRRPRYLIAAHRDSKSQPVPTAARTALFVGAGLGLAGLVLAGALGLGVPDVLDSAFVGIAGLTALGCGWFLAFCGVGNDSPGALDNATGLAATLGVARRVAGVPEVGLLLTDAEEFGLAGARAAARRLPKVMGLINLDGFDDEGDFHLVERYGWPRRRGFAPNLAATLLAAANALGESVVRRSLPFGLRVEHVAFADAGTPAITLMRGTSRSLRRVHLPSDDLDHLRGDGVGRAIALVDGALALLRSPAPPRGDVLPPGLTGRTERN